MIVLSMQIFRLNLNLQSWASKGGQNYQKLGREGEGTTYFLPTTTKMILFCPKTLKHTKGKGPSFAPTHPPAAHAYNAAELHYPVFV